MVSEQERLYEIEGVGVIKVTTLPFALDVSLGLDVQLRAGSMAEMVSDDRGLR